MGVAHGRGPEMSLSWLEAVERGGFEPMCLVVILNGLKLNAEEESNIYTSSSIILQSG